MTARIVGVAIVVCTSLGFSQLAAQARPNFSGTWTVVPEPNAGAKAFEPPLGSTLTITQTEKTLTLKTTYGELTCNLDGTEVKVNSGWHKARWDRDKLIIEVADRGWGGTGDWRYRLSLDGTGRLIIDTWNYSKSGAPVPRVVYRKS